MKSDVLIVGAGPAGIAAAVRAKEGGAQVAVVDDNAAIGGQIWRAGTHVHNNPQAQSWMQRLRAAEVTTLSGTRVISVDIETRTCVLETDEAAKQIRFEKLILATGAREFFLPFPGWTLPGVVGVGGVQALAKAGAPMAGKRIVVAGSGPLLLAVASYLHKHGATVVLIAEQASRAMTFGFAARLFRYPAKAKEAVGLRSALRGVPYRMNCWVETAEGDGQVARVQVRCGGQSWTEECDYAAVAYGLRPNTELASLLGCRMARGAIEVDHLQRTSVAHVFAAGECTGIGGVELSIVEGEMAGYAAAGKTNSAVRLQAARRRALRFADALNKAFVPRPELRELPRPATVVCRCEDVPFERLPSFPSFRAAKLHTRCGMGACQGRICAPATEFLFGWECAGVRPPVFPVRVATSISQNGREAT